MPPKPKVQLDKGAWQWAETTDHLNVTQEHVKSAYRLNLPTCHRGACKRNCKGNPFCLNNLGEKVWFQPLDEAKLLTYDENQERRQEGHFVGLKNLGATCYVNTFLQLWFHNPAVRKALYEWTDPSVPDEYYPGWKPDSICGHLQVIFALLHGSARCYVDPTPLIECLGLNTAEQQDAQEFSKLFLHVLESALSDNGPAKGNVIERQFCGSYCYVTECQRCGSESETSATFYELDLNIRGHSTLAASVKDFLQEEKLEGDNQYMCSTCNSKQNAKRAIRLKRLPEVLNLQLLRFVFDKNKGHKKKLSSFIQFPETLDMSPYLHVGEGVEKQEVLYELTAVLIHRGPTAYSGHYIAHIREQETGAWYKFNDEEIEKMNNRKLELGKEEDNLESGTSEKAPKASKGNHSSRNAYMLVYRRKHEEGQSHGDGSDFNEVELPAAVRGYVANDNQQFENDISEQLHLQEQSINHQKLTHEEMKAIYESLPVRNLNEPWEWVSTQWISNWLSSPSESEKVKNKIYPCCHGRLRADEVVRMKCISGTGAEVLFSKYPVNERFPGESQLCQQCVIRRCREIRTKMCMADDDKLFSMVQKNIPVLNENETYYWVSRKHLRSWKRFALGEIDAQPISSASISSPTSTNPRVEFDNPETHSLKSTPTNSHSIVSSSSDKGFARTCHAEPDKSLSHDPKTVSSCSPSYSGSTTCSSNVITPYLSTSPTSGEDCHGSSSSPVGLSNSPTALSQCELSSTCSLLSDRKDNHCTSLVNTPNNTQAVVSSSGCEPSSSTTSRKRKQPTSDTQRKTSKSLSPTSKSCSSNLISSSGDPPYDTELRMKELTGGEGSTNANQARTPSSPSASPPESPDSGTVVLRTQQGHFVNELSESGLIGEAEEYETSRNSEGKDVNCRLSNGEVKSEERDSGEGPSLNTELEEMGDEQEEKFNDDILCQHGNLKIDSSGRRLIPTVAWERLLYYFPNLTSFTQDSDICIDCWREQQEEQQLKDSLRQEKQGQKELLQNLYHGKNRPKISDPWLGQTAYVVCTSFIEGWRKFVKHSMVNDSVQEIVNGPLLCQHKLLVYKPEDMNSFDNVTRFTLVWEEEWHVLTQYYAFDVEIQVAQLPLDELGRFSLITIPEVCQCCLEERLKQEEEGKFLFSSQTIYIRKILDGSTGEYSSDMSKENGKGYNYDPEFSAPPGQKSGKGRRQSSEVPPEKQPKLDAAGSSGLGSGDAGSSSAGPSRKSTRHRKTRGEKEITVSSTMTLKQLQKELFKLYSVLPMDQNLSLDGRSLNDVDATLQDLKVYPQCVIFLKADEPTTQAPMTHDDLLSVPTGPEEGFKGTNLLGR